MVAIYRVKESQLSERRLDAWHHQPSFLSEIRRIIMSTGTTRLEDNIDLEKGVASGATPLGAIYLEKGKVRFYRTSEVDNLTLDGETAVFISEEDDEQLKRSRLKENDVLLTITGAKFGKSAVVEKKHLPGNISQHSVRFCPNSNLDSYFLVAYLSCHFGQIAIWREAYGATRPAIDFPSIRSLPLPNVSFEFQKYIGNKVRQAELLREKCTQIEIELNNEMMGVFEGKPKPKTRSFKRLPVNVLTHNRLDPDFYSLVSQWSESEIKNGPNSYYLLDELTTRIKDGPGGWGVSTNDYRPNGIPVIRSVNIVNGECDLTDCVFISEEKHQELIGHEAKKGSVVLSVRGTVGRAAVFEDDMINSASLNAAVVTLDCKDSLNPYYLAAFFNSSVGNTQANRIANGAVQLNMNLTETASNLIPLPPIDVQEKIEAIYRKLISARKINRMLLVASKALVEALVEGKVTENEIIAAQQALENDDNTKDRAILSKLTDKGYAVKEGKPLFSDLDALYELLEEALQDKDQD